MKQKNNSPSIGSKMLGNRTVIGIICIVAALAICFGVTPLVNKSASDTTEIVRVKNTVPKGSIITANAIEMVEVGSYNLPKGVYTSKEDVIGKCAKGDLFAGEYLLPDKLTTDAYSATDILGDLDGEQKVISITIGSFAQGVSGKLETGDIISVIVYNSKENETFTPDELRYVRVVTSTTSKGIDKVDVTDNSQPVTVTLLVNKEQAELLAKYEKTASMHFTLEYRGDEAIAEKYLDEQAAYFEGR